jgi:hypothetical protein
MLTFAVVFLTWCALSVPIGILIARLANARAQRRLRT